MNVASQEACYGKYDAITWQAWGLKYLFPQIACIQYEGGCNNNAGVGTSVPNLNNTSTVMEIADRQVRHGLSIHHLSINNNTAWFPSVVIVAYPGLILELDNHKPLLLHIKQAGKSLPNTTTTITNMAVAKKKVCYGRQPSKQTRYARLTPKQIQAIKKALPVQSAAKHWRDLEWSFQPLK